MREFLNDYLFNTIINAILTIFALIIWLSARSDSKKYPTDIEKNFSSALFYYFLYMILMTVQFLLFHYIDNSTATFIYGMIRVFCVACSYTYFGRWIISIIEERRRINSHLKRMHQYSFRGLFPLMVILYITTHNLTVVNIPLILYYALIGGIITYYHKWLDKEQLHLILVFFFPTLILTIQSYWNHTPINIYVTLCTLLIYNRIWQGRKDDYLEKERHYAKQEAELEDARTRLVLSQIQPHFLYNTLSSISYLCKKNPTEASELTVNFSDYLRNNLDALSISGPVSFSKELSHVKKYLQIEQIRFGDVLKVEYNIQCSNFTLPVLTVEPLVENAVKHGICRKTSGGTLIISTEELENGYRITVADNGVGFDTAILSDESGEHIGIKNVRRRLHTTCDGNLEISSTVGVGTTAVITVPKIKKSAGNHT